MPGAFQSLAQALEINPHNAKAYLFLGTLYLLIREEDTERYDPKAESSFRKVIEIAPDSDLAQSARWMLTSEGEEEPVFEDEGPAAEAQEDAQ